MSPRRPILFVAIVLVAGLVAYGVTRWRVSSPLGTPDAAARLAWVAQEFKLSPEQAAEVARLHAAYQPVCDRHCAAVVEARKTLAAASTPEARALAEAELTRLKDVCTVATRAHLLAVAAALPAAEAPRFLALMEPRIAHTGDRDGAPALDGRP